MVFAEEVLQKAKWPQINTIRCKLCLSIANSVKVVSGMTGDFCIVEATQEVQEIAQRQKAIGFSGPKAINQVRDGYPGVLSDRFCVVWGY